MTGSVRPPTENCVLSRVEFPIFAGPQSASALVEHGRFQ
jgi:hypothetical protein